MKFKNVPLYAQVALLVAAVGLDFITGALLADIPTEIHDPKMFLPSTTGWQPLELQTITNRAADSTKQEVQRYEAAGGKGDPVSLLTLAVMHERGLGLITNVDEAARLCRKAAEMGFAPAQHQFGLYLNAGIGVRQDMPGAISWFEKAAVQGHVPAEYLLGYCYLNGEGVRTNFAKANEHFRKAADRNYAPAIHNLAVSFVRGRSVETNRAEAIRLFRRAGELGSDYSRAVAAGLLAGEREAESIAEAARLARVGAERGDILSQRFLADMYRDGHGVPRNEQESARWLRKAAGRGEPAVDAQMGTYYMEGIGVERDYAAAMYWLESAARASNALAMANLGVLYSDGKGVPTNHAKAIELFRQSSARGNGFGWLNLGRMHALGLGVAQDWKEAYACYRRSADADWPRGYLMTALCHIHGHGTQTNAQEAIHYLTKAAQQRETEAIGLLSRLLSINNPGSNAVAGVVSALELAATRGSFEAAHELGRLHMTGKLVPADRGKAMKYLSQAATNGIPLAATQLGMLLMDPKDAARDLPQAWWWIEYAAERDDMLAMATLAARHLYTPTERNIPLGTNLLWRGVQKSYPNCMTFLGELLHQGKLIPQDQAAGMELMRRSAELGHAPAQSFLGVQTLRVSLAEAYRYLEMAAEQNWPQAIGLLGMFYIQGQHVQRDLKRGREYLARAAELHDVFAQYTYATMLMNGTFETNLAQAAMFFKAAAEQGSPPAQYWYGQFLADGRAGIRDLVEAWKWLELASAAKDQSQNTGKWLDWLRRVMSPEQIEEGRRRASHFTPLIKARTAYMTEARPRGMAGSDQQLDLPGSGLKQ